MRHVAAVTLVFTSGFAIMVLEIVGARYLAKDFGGSFYVWVSQIGVILAALALGYSIGGILADRWQRASRLAWLLFPAGLLTGFIPSFSPRLIDWIILRHPSGEPIPAVWQKLDPAIGSALVFLIPCLVLSILPPYFIRLATQRLTQIGRTSGLIYSSSTVGSIAGVFVSGYVLIDRMTLSKIFGMTGIVVGLLGAACLFMDRLFVEARNDGE